MFVFIDILSFILYEEYFKGVCHANNVCACRLFGFNGGRLRMDERIDLSMSDLDLVPLLIQVLICCGWKSYHQYSREF